MQFEKAAYILKAIAHPTRLKVIDVLMDKDRLTVNELASKTGCEQSLLSHHLTGLRLKGILKAEKDGLNVFYSLKEKNITPVISCIQQCNCNM
jgi:ArsR family transcriptional regulator